MAAVESKPDLEHLSRTQRLVRAAGGSCLMLSMGFLYIVLAVVYDLTIGDGIGNGVKSFALALLGLWVVMSLVWYTGMLDRLPGPPEERPPPRPDYSDALRYEPTVLGQVTPGRWQIIWKRASRRRLRRAFALLARVPVAVALGVLLVLGEEKALFEFLPDRPLFRVPITAIALVLLLFGSGYLLRAAYRDLRRPATFVVGRVTRARPVKGKPGKTDSCLLSAG